MPPPGTPAFLACERVRTGLSCQNLNGDEHVPVSAGIYGAIPASDWRLVRLGPNRYGQLPPGISFTRAEIRLLDRPRPVRPVIRPARTVENIIQKPE